MALLRVISDLLATINHQQVSLFGLLDLSAMLDLVDHGILIQWLEKTFGIRGS